VLEVFDADLADMLVEKYRASGIDVLTGAPVTEVRQADGTLEVVCGDGHVVACDMAVHGAGRVPALEGLDLEAAGVPFGRGGIDVDTSMRSTGNSRVFAAGDAAALGLPLTPVAIVQARVALANILDSGSASFAPAATPSVVFSDPVLAAVVLTEEQAAGEGLDVEAKLSDTSSWASSRRIGQRVSGAKTIVERGTGRIVGAHLLGHGAGEVINVFAAAIAGGLSAADLKGAIWAYPTAASEIAYLL
jgi:glutathione reductase (NADPH)